MPSDELAETAASASAPTRPAGERPRAGDTIGRYVIERELGAGGMGVVYAAHDPDLDRRVALKLLHADGLGAGPEARTRLLREARAMAKVSHANVITVYEVGTAGGVDFVAMELVDGTNLADWLRATRRPTPDILRVFRAAGRGLAAAHAMGLVHRDFKPANVLIAGGGSKVVVTDFGLARAFDDPDAAQATTAVAAAPRAGGAAGALDVTVDAGAGTPTPRPTARPLRTDSADLSSTLTRTGAVLGTPAYMAPEQFKGETAGPRADQYAFAVALWEGLAGARPFRGASFDELRQAVERGAAADADRIPRALRAVISRGLAREPAARWRDVDELLTALDRAERRPRALRLGLGIALALALVLVLVVVGRSPAGNAATPAVATCAITDAELDAVWSPAIAQQLAARFGDDPAWPTARAAIDRHTAEWRGERARTCAEPAAREYHGRVACLYGLRDELGAITELARTMPADALRGGSVAEILTPPEACRSGVRVARPAVPADPHARAELGAIQRDGTMARISARAGQAAPARALATATVARARALGEPVALASALEAAGTVEHVLGDCAAAEPLYAEAATVAESGSAPGLRAMAKMGHLECVIRRTSDIDKIRSQAREAEAAVRGAGGDRSLTAVLDLNLAQVDAMVGELDRAIDRIAAARGVFAELGDPRRTAVAASTEAGLRSYRDGPGDEDRALALTREALASSEAAFGADHRQTRATRRALAMALLQRDPVEARGLFAQLAAGAAPDPHAPVLPRPLRAHGRVLLPDGRPAADAHVHVRTLMVASDDGVPLPVEYDGTPAEVVITGPDGRFDVAGPESALALATRGELRSQIVEVTDRELTLRLAPGVRAEGTVALTNRPTLASDADTTLRLAARVPSPGVMLIGTGRAMTYQALARVDATGRWSAHHLPAGTPLLAAVGSISSLGDKLVVARPLTARPMDLSLDLGGVVLDLVVRADRAAAIPSAQLVVFGGRVTPLPHDGPSLRQAMGTTARWSSAMASPVADGTRTRAGAAVYQAGDIHGRVSSFPAGPVTACVVPFAGDIADEAFLRQLTTEADLEARCVVLQVAPTPAVQAFVLETPPMRRLPPRPPAPPVPPPPPPPPSGP